ncbi:GNAT family N-acetyltransferase [Paenibacillus methanolicus]|uniref:Acetyltransferase (GNAT) family protein n=1 Tax=Paenibacillus methanolicus TaxID=582686 RepID=A0A5S5CFM6_9BACL|nr:GNAT family N-acetyltransferase [Paenibacillus methanolicus]TYP78211.1 acetyltransferase (GNAT) family protein [Paenibacillus methanolicus]
MTVTIAQTDEQISATFAIMKQLRPHLAEDAYVQTIRSLQEQGYRLAVIFAQGEAKAAAGYRIGANLAWGRFLYVDDLITDEASRASGYAGELMDWLDEEALRAGCQSMYLDSGVQRHDAHRFYLKRRMRIAAHHFDRVY